MPRFDWIYDETRTGQHSWDADLTPDCEFATIPTTGSILPNWLLFLPRNRVLSIKHLKAPQRQRLMRHAQVTMERLQSVCEPFTVTYFEHGASEKGSPTGCGVDHAHLHAVPLPFSLSNVFAVRNANARIVDDNDPWAKINPGEYLFCADAEGTYWAPVLSPESQYFRRLIASEIGYNDQWDYKTFPFPENIEKTLTNFHVE